MDEEEGVARGMVREINVKVDDETYEKVVRACTEPGFWRSLPTSKDKPVWTFTQELGARHVVDFNVYTPLDTHNPADEEAECWCEAVIFQRDADDPVKLHEENCVLADNGPFDSPWFFTLDDVDYRVSFR